MVQMNIQINKTPVSRVNEVDFEKLVFGKHFSDHMYMVDFVDGAWQQAQILPYGDMLIKPSLSALHHAQAIFEGMKVFKNKQGEIFFFRLYDNYHRMNRSAERMCMPRIPEDIFVEGLKQLVRLDKDWIPDEEGKALYVRPVYFSIDEVIGVKPAENYRLVIITTPTGAYYPEPLKVLVETNYSRSSEGGTGYAKAAGNYGGAMYPTKLAMQKGYHQLIWTDAIENKYIEESGSMNVMFVISDVLVTPSLSNSKLAGITRDSILKLAVKMGIKVEERNITVDEIIHAQENGTLQEAFGVGTAANVAPICLIGHNGKDYHLPPVEGFTVAHKIGKALTDIKMGKAEDSFGWVTKL
jgi:branched-chain amino acid aminotransferase